MKFFLLIIFMQFFAKYDCVHYLSEVIEDEAKILDLPFNHEHDVVKNYIATMVKDLPIENDTDLKTSSRHLQRVTPAFKSKLKNVRNKSLKLSLLKVDIHRNTPKEERDEIVFEALGFLQNQLIADSISNHLANGHLFKLEGSNDEQTSTLYAHIHYGNFTKHVIAEKAKIFFDDYSTIAHLANAHHSGVERRLYAYNFRNIEATGSFLIFAFLTFRVETFSLSYVKFKANMKKYEELTAELQKNNWNTLQPAINPEHYTHKEMGAINSHALSLMNHPGDIGFNNDYVDLPYILLFHEEIPIDSLMQYFIDNDFIEKNSGKVFWDQKDPRRYLYLIFKNFGEESESRIAESFTVVHFGKTKEVLYFLNYTFLKPNCRMDSISTRKYKVNQFFEEYIAVIVYTTNSDNLA